MMTETNSSQSVGADSLSISDFSAMRKTVPNLEKVIAINYYGRSGSALLQSLFDNHPNTVVTPGVFLWFFYEFFEQKASLPPFDLIASFIRDFDVIFDGNGTCVAYSDASVGQLGGFTTMGPARNERVEVDRELFRKCLSELLAEYSEAVPRKRFFQAVHAAYSHALNPQVQLSAETRIVFPIHAPLPNKYTAQFAQDFPETKYILMVRRPIETVASTFRFQTSIGGYLQFLNAVLMPSLFGGVPCVDSAREQSRAVRLEDLHRNPRETMELLCSWLRLPWNECLLSSTYNGKSWWGDGRSLQVNGFSETIVAKRHSQNLPPVDVERLNVLLAPKAVHWNYEVEKDDLVLSRKLWILPLLVLPFSMEIEYLFAERLSKLAYSKNKLRTEGLIRLFKLIYWLSGLGVVVVYFQIRKLLLYSWLGTFQKSRTEVSLLS